MSIGKQKELTSLVLKEVFKYIDSEALVAGGAPRDWIRGVEANDIDLYLRTNVEGGGPKFKLIKKLFENSHKVEKIDYSSRDHLIDYGGLNVPITSIQNVLIDDVLFQFIFIDPSVKDLRKSILNHMDIGINRVGFDSCDFIYTPEYIYDKSKQTLTLYTECMEGYKLKHCMTHHLPKMLKYFPDYRLEIKN